MTPPLYLLVVPFPPTVNNYYDHVSRKITRGEKAGKVFTSKRISDAGLVFRAEVARLSRLGHRTPPQLSGRLAIRAIAYPPDARARDLDNLGKALLDALTAARVILDDSQFDEFRVLRGPARPPRGALRLGIWRPDAVDFDALSTVLGAPVVDLFSKS